VVALGPRRVDDDDDDGGAEMGVRDRLLLLVFVLWPKDAAFSAALAAAAWVFASSLASASAFSLAAFLGGRRDSA
jgi:hypothetical protein